jgi:PPK2 family polyphosphate:nucleotide phosphotransferase
MKTDLKQITHFANDYKVTKGAKFKLKHFDPADTDDFKTHDHAKDLMAAGLKLMSDLQEKLYAQERWSLLLIFQAMDAAGKDGTIKHVMSGINPQGCEVTSFKAPTTIDLSHDFLWRSNIALPPRGRIGIFNRSYYEEVLVVRVHKELLHAERLPGPLVTKHLWKERFEDINAYERYLTRNGVIIRKFFLNVSKGEQKKRFLSRLDEPSKHWKFAEADLKERTYWHDYMEAYEEMIRATATPDAPWYVVPADNKWFTHLVVAGAIIDTLDSLKLSLPEVSVQQRKTLDAARKVLGK